MLACFSSIGDQGGPLDGYAELGGVYIYIIYYSAKLGGFKREDL
jgi:hypothetical protein